jgi:hypothetical protein
MVKNGKGEIVFVYDMTVYTGALKRHWYSQLSTRERTSKIVRILGTRTQ